MPAYKHRPPKAGDTPVWRYLSLAAVFETIKKRRLRLTRVDTFRDSFEGSVPKKQIDDQVPLFAGANALQMMMNSVAAHYPGMALVTPPDEDPMSRITRLRRARTRSAHASCWSMEGESDLLWRLYCADGGREGIALRTTLSRLEESVAAHNLYVSPITYVPYQGAPAFTDEMDSLFHKRHGFTAECELRLLKFDEAHYSALVPRDSSVSDLPKHIFVDWIAGEVIDEIIVSPYASESYEELVRHAIIAAEPRFEHRVLLSELHERRHAPGF
jgi:hypothetical protein